MTRNKISITIALFLMFALVVSAIPFTSAQNWNISISAAADTGLVRIEVRLGSTRQQVPFTGVSLGYLAPGGAWQNITGLTTDNGRIDYIFHTLKTNGVWHFQARVPAQSPLPANPATPDGSWYSQEVTLDVKWEFIDLPTFCIVNVAPIPVGVTQSVFVNVFMSKPNIGATMSTGGTAGAHYTDLYVDITRPDGVKETFGPYVADPTGGFWLSYTPATVGNYTAQGRFLGQDTRDDNGNAFTSGNGVTSSANRIFTYLPDDSPILTFTVQEEPVLGWQQPPLPTEYWSRPIYSTNWDWGSQEGSNWWGMGTPSFSATGGYDATGNVQPYGKAPNSAHIMWTKSTAPGGQPGGSIASDQEGQFTSTSITRHHWEPIIVYGIVFYDEYPTSATPSNLDNMRTWEAVDIRTGETLWSRSRGITGSETLSCGMIQKFHSVQEYGSWGALWASGSGGMSYLYDIWTGAHMANVTNTRPAPMFGSSFQGIVDTSSDDYRNQGGILEYYTSSGNLICWNSTRLFSNGASGTRDWNNGIEWQVNMSATYPAGTPTSVSVTSTEVLLLSSIPTLTSYASNGTMICAGVSARDGSLLWGPTSYTIPATHDISMYSARDGAWVLVDKDTQDIYCYSTEDGHKMWGPVSLVPYTNPWSYIELDATVYGDKVIFWDFGGNVVGLDKASGTILWHYNRGSSGFVTPYGIYPLWDFGSQSYADGKAYFSEGSMYDVPLHPARRICINVTDGKELWSILSYSGRCPGAIADGYLLEWNSLSNEIVCFGKGPTATTAVIENDVITFGQKVAVKGMVTDISPGTNVYNREARFPHGVAAVSEESQREWMEYVYMQQVKPAATGVEVTITVYDPNGNTYDVGTTKSDGNGYYGLTFEPEVPGEYVVTARFAGSESYWGSFAQTYLFVDEAPAATPTATPPPASMTDTYVTGFGIGIIIAIVVVGLLLFLRKR